MGFWWSSSIAVCCLLAISTDAKLFLGRCNYEGFCAHKCRRVGEEFMECYCQAGFLRAPDGRRCQAAPPGYIDLSTLESSGSIDDENANCDNEGDNCNSQLETVTGASGEGGDDVEMEELESSLSVTTNPRATPLVDGSKSSIFAINQAGMTAHNNSTLTIELNGSPPEPTPTLSLSVLHLSLAVPLRSSSLPIEALSATTEKSQHVNVIMPSIAPDIANETGVFLISSSYVISTAFVDDDGARASFITDTSITRSVSLLLSSQSTPALTTLQDRSQSYDGDPLQPSLNDSSIMGSDSETQDIVHDVTPAQENEASTESAVYMSALIKTDHRPLVEDGTSGVFESGIESDSVLILLPTPSVVTLMTSSLFHNYSHVDRLATPSMINVQDFSYSSAADGHDSSPDAVLTNISVSSLVESSLHGFGSALHRTSLHGTVHNWSEMLGEGLQSTPELFFATSGLLPPLSSSFDESHSANWSVASSSATRMLLAMDIDVTFREAKSSAYLPVNDLSITFVENGASTELTYASQPPSMRDLDLTTAPTSSSKTPSEYNFLQEEESSSMGSYIKSDRLTTSASIVLSSMIFRSETSPINVTQTLEVPPIVSDSRTKENIEFCKRHKCSCSKCIVDDEVVKCLCHEHIPSTSTKLEGSFILIIGFLHVYWCANFV